MLGQLNVFDLYLVTGAIAAIRGADIKNALK